MRARQRRRLPSVLVTTPESLSLLLSHADSATAFAALGVVVVIGSKRGVQLELCLASLRRRAPDLVTWGLSATLGNASEATAVLHGPGEQLRLVQGAVEKRIHVHTLVPA